MEDFDEFELQYADELDLLDEELPPDLSQGPSKTAAQIQTPRSFPSPQFSQISADSAHRRLFSASDQPNNKRFASTPFPGPSKATRDEVLNEIQNTGIQSRKRRLEDIFGDIHDIVEEEPFSECDPVQKKPKSEEERDLEIIEAILQARKQLNSNTLMPRSNQMERLEAMHAFKAQNLSRIAPKWPALRLLRGNQERVYVRFHSEEFESRQISEVGAREATTSLLGASKQRVWAEAAEINLRRVENSSQQAVEEVVEIHEGHEALKLWVERYKPRKYFDLLSEESCNRHLLKWIKLWDKVVFNREVKKPEDAKSLQQQKLNTFNKKTGRFESSGGWVRRNKTNLNTDLDETNRPVQKIALISGPPGLGKTTLAHTIARHAGYEPLEINASDDRTPEAFRLALENGTQMQSVFAGHKKPNCIILDEIDGAPTASIEFLLRFAAGAVKERSTKASKGENKLLLRRPIICICNDLYTASLRQLRQQAFVITVPPTDSAKLVDRLLSIAREQRVKTDMATLFALAEKTGNDIRSCLSLLQFFASKKRQLSMLDVIKSNIGQKDQQKELFKIWGSIFQIQRPSRASALTSEDSSQGGLPMTTLPPSLRMKYVLQVVHRNSDYEKLAQGVYENYLQQKMPDPNMNGITEAADWFSFNDRLHALIHHSQNYGVYAYLPFSFVSWHFLFATHAWPKITYPSKPYEVSQKLQVTKNILTALRRNMEVSKRGIGESPACDSIPLLKRILCPTLRSVSLQLLTPREKADVKCTVDIMADLGLSFIQLRSPDGTYQYQLEPDIEHLGVFPEHVAGPQLSYWCKQLIAREVEVERMHRAQAKEATTESKTKKRKKEPAVPNFLQTLQPKKIQEKPKEPEVVRKDFFGRVTRVPANSEGGKEGFNTDNIVKSPVWYRYKEGFDNAVRRNVTIAELM